jgi:hypothetical protein
MKDSEHTDSLQERPDRAVRNSSSVGTRGSRQIRSLGRVECDFEGAVLLRAVLGGNLEDEVR